MNLLTLNWKLLNIKEGKIMNWFNKLLGKQPTLSQHEIHLRKMSIFVLLLLMNHLNQ